MSRWSLFLRLSIFILHEIWYFLLLILLDWVMLYAKIKWWKTKTCNGAPWSIFSTFRYLFHQYGISLTGLFFTHSLRILSSIDWHSNKFKICSGPRNPVNPAPPAPPVAGLWWKINFKEKGWKNKVGFGWMLDCLKIFGMMFTYQKCVITYQSKIR